MNASFVTLGLLLLGGALLAPWLALALAIAARREAREARDQVASLRAELVRWRAAAAVAPSVRAAPREAGPSSAATDESLDDTAELSPANGPRIAGIAGTSEALAPSPPIVSPLASPPPAPVSTPAAATPPSSIPTPRPAGMGALEERLGSRLPVWLGGIALALSGVYLVQYSIERGWLSPVVRVSLGIAFGLSLLTLGELLHRRAARIAQALSAAGIADLYACFLAASTLYGLLSRPAAFTLMALNTALAVGLSLRQGPIVATLGLAGGFLTPALLRSETPSVPGLLGYLLLLQAGSFAVTRRRGWTALAALSIAGVTLWVLALAVGERRPHDALAVGLFLLASGAVASWAGLRPAAAGNLEGFGGSGAWLAAGATGSGLLAYAALTGAAGNGPVEWTLLALLAVGCLLLARRSAELEGLAWFASAAIVLTLAGWATRLEAGEAERFALTGLLLGLLLAVQAYASQWGAARPARWAGLAAAAPLAVALVVFVGAQEDLPDVPWGASALALAAVFTAAAAPLARRRATLPEGEERLAALAVAATSFATASGPIELGTTGLTVGWALEVPALLALALRLRVPVLARLAAGLGGAVALRLLLNPWVLDYPVGTTPILNGLLGLYGLPALAFLAAAILASRLERPRFAEGLGWGAAAFVAMLTGLSIRHAFGAGALRGTSSSLLREAAALGLAWAVLGLAMLASGEGRRWRPAFAWLDRPLRWGGRGLLSTGLVVTLVGPGVFLSPLFRAEEVGAAPLANALAWIFGGPLVVALAGLAVVKRTTVPASPSLLARAWSVASLVLVWGLVSLEVRQFFHGSRLDLGATSGAEKLAYSVSWIALGLALLWLGISRRGGGSSHRALRQAGLAVMLLAVLKVFLLDLGQLAGLDRVLSLLGLGASLLALAALYQRVLGRPD